MYKVAWAYLKNDEDVADAISETILNCYEKLSTLKKDSYFKTWMIRILINNCNEMLRHKGRVFPAVEMEEGTFEEPGYLDCRVEGNPGVTGRKIQDSDSFVLQQGT